MERTHTVEFMHLENACTNLTARRKDFLEM